MKIISAQRTSAERHIFPVHSLFSLSSSNQTFYQIVYIKKIVVLFCILECKNSLPSGSLRLKYDLHKKNLTQFQDISNSIKNDYYHIDEVLN